MGRYFIRFPKQEVTLPQTLTPEHETLITGGDARFALNSQLYCMLYERDVFT